MHHLFCLEYKRNILYKIYWHILKTIFNIKFIFPRSDTCAGCNIYKDKLSDTFAKKELSALITQSELHLRKAQAFFGLRRKYKAQAEANEIECWPFDYIQNLPLCFIPSNSAFYVRQLWYYLFVIYNLENKKVIV
ncbi:hypothetical protein RN001_006604 [Aquatica leii]|uniref:Uncharacterized protein n=1 Tax=Aquatica leii TaxID=1421715 RepID=A0AAN7P8B6_9COLE|nr:hypothetical protein RN001_006604 [Aquatica leii]